MVDCKRLKFIPMLIAFILLMGCSSATASPTPTATATPVPAPTASATPTLAPGQERMDAAGIAQVWVPPGSFQMGSDEATIEELRALNPPAWVASEFASEQPQHEVRLTSGYWIDKYEVTNQAFEAFVEAGGYTNEEYWSEEGAKWLSRQNLDRFPLSCAGDDPEYPRLCVTWYEAEAYATWRGGRLPTEAEWEFAARGPESLRYPWGDEFDRKRANVVSSSGPRAVGSYADGVSWIGAHDMSGNAMEWVQDWLDVSYYQQGVAEDPRGPESGRVKVEKGGWWGSNPFVARSAYRHYEDPPTYNDHHIGFRVVSP